MRQCSLFWCSIICFCTLAKVTPVHIKSIFMFTFYTNHVTSPLCMYLVLILLKGNQYRRLAELICRLLQNEKHLTYSIWLECAFLKAFSSIFFKEVGQCLLISDVGCASDGESCTEKDLLSQNDSSPFIPQCFPRLFISAFLLCLPLSLVLSCHIHVQLCTDDFRDAKVG